jgi:formylglycine-generating enzyme required for sulfatase activity
MLSRSKQMMMGLVVSFSCCISPSIALKLQVTDAIGQPGQQVTVSLDVIDASGASGAFKIKYDDKSLSLVDVEETEFYKDLYTGVRLLEKDTPGVIFGTFINLSNVSGGNGSLIEVFFTIDTNVLPGTVIDLQLVEVEITDENGIPLDIEIESGHISVENEIKPPAGGTNTGFSISISPLSIFYTEVGQIVNVEIIAYNTTRANQTLISAKYDPDIFSFISFLPGDLIPSMSPLLKIESDNGSSVIRIAGASLGGNPGSGDGSLGSLNFEIIKEIPQEGAYISIIEVEVNNSSVDTSVIKFSDREKSVRIDPLSTVNTGDFDGNGEVDFGDFFSFADHFGMTSTSPNWDPLFDLNGDNVVDFDDFFLFADSFGKKVDTGQIASNKLPHADAGSDQIVELGTVIHLNGSGSTDPDDDTLTYVWTENEINPEMGILSDVSDPGPSLTISSIGTYIFALTVNDGQIDSVPDEVRITVILPNRPPKANAGTDQFVNIGETLTLDGSGSSDSDDDELTYAWTEDAENPAMGLLSDATVVSPTVSTMVQGTYIFTLVVNDGQTDSAPDEVEITVTKPEPQPEPVPGGDLTVELPGGIQMEFMWIEPGSFMMGWPEITNRIEFPQHEVTISRGFFLGKYEVTQGQWEAVMGTAPWSEKDNVQVSPNHPAVYISWNDMQAFAGKLNEIAGEELYRLPTEAEWEYACRAGTTTLWSFGDDETQLGDYAWYSGNAWEVGEQYAHAVGLKLPNPWGLYDMHGNVSERCQDFIGDYPFSDQTDPTGPTSGYNRVERGGYFRSNAQGVRSGVRDGYPPGDGYYSTGVRLVRMEKSGTSNRSPTADAGEDQRMQVGVIVQLDGSRSRDPDWDELSYHWQQKAGPEIAFWDSGDFEDWLVSPLSEDLDDDGDIDDKDFERLLMSKTKTFFVPDTPGIYTFALVVNDGMADSTPDEVSVTVIELEEQPDETITAELPGGATMEFVWIEPGTFMMGVPESIEDTQHEVTISRGFYLGKYEITQGQWEAVMDNNPSSFKSPDRPVEQVSWTDMQGFIAKLNEEAGEEIYRLPTEAEWEYACKAGTETTWSFGDDSNQLKDYAWYRDNGLDAGLEYAQPVGLKLPNPWGLYDMHGNVCEWCQDWFGNYPSGAQVDPTGSVAGSQRVHRGGGFAAFSFVLKSENRGRISPDFRSFHIGARLLKIR